MHEDLFHNEHAIHNLPNASAQAFQDDLRLAWRLFPSLNGSATGSVCANLYSANWLVALGVHLELLLMARVPSFHSIDRDAAQDQSNREPNVPLRSHARSLSLLLHSQLVSYGRVFNFLGSTGTK